MPTKLLLGLEYLFADADQHTRETGGEKISDELVVRSLWQSHRKSNMHFRPGVSPIL